MKYIKLYEDFNTNETQQYAVLQHAKNLDKKRKDDDDDDEDYTPPKSKPFQYKGPEEIEGEGEVEEYEGEEREETEED